MCFADINVDDADVIQSMSWSCDGTHLICSTKVKYKLAEPFSLAWLVTKKEMVSL